MHSIEEATLHKGHIKYFSGNYQSYSNEDSAIETLPILGDPGGR